MFLTLPWWQSAEILSVFIGFMLLVLVLDFYLFGDRKGKNPERAEAFKPALKRSLFWLSVGLSFTVLIYFFQHQLHGIDSLQDLRQYKTKYNANFQIGSDYLDALGHFRTEVLIQYITGYFIEYSLSVDNLFVIMLIFQSFKVAKKFHQRILFWGVVGAIVMRFTFIVVGGALINQFHWIMYVFGAILLYSGFKLLIRKEENDEIDTQNHPMVKLASKLFKITPNTDKGEFFIKKNGVKMVTPLFVVLLVVEFSDVVFAVDSVPAIFGITRDPFLVFFSNIFAIMGLRSLFFLLGHGINKLHTLHYGLSLILIFIGAKMIFEDFFHSIGFTHLHNLLVLVGILTLTVLSAYVLPAPKSTHK